MAVSYVADFKTYNNPTAGSTVSITTSGLAAGDLLLATVTLPSTTTTITPDQAGWTEVTFFDTTASTQVQSRTWWREAASAGETFTWTLSTGQRYSAVIRARRGHSSSSPINASDQAATASGTSHATPSITTTVGDCWIEGIWSYKTGANTTADPAGRWTTPDTERVDICGTNTSVNAALGVGDTNTGVTAGSYSKTATSADTTIALAGIIAIAPAGTITNAEAATAAGVAEDPRPDLGPTAHASGSATAHNATVSTDTASDIPGFVDSSSAQNTGVTSLNVAVPAAAAAGDFALLGVSVVPGDVTTPTGWELLSDSGVTDTSAGGALYVYTRLLEAGDLGTNVALAINTSSRVAAGMVVYDPAAVDVSGFLAGTNSSTVTAPSVATTVDAVRLVTFHGVNTYTSGDQPTWTAATGMAERVDTSSLSGSAKNASILIADQLDNGTAGATGTRDGQATANIQGQAVTVGLHSTAAFTTAEAQVAEAIGEALFSTNDNRISLNLVGEKPIDVIASPMDPTTTVPFLTDEFTAVGSHWAEVDPAGDCTVTATGTHARLSAPASEHNQRAGLSKNRDALKLLQNVSGNFDYTIKFDALPTQAWDGWGWYLDGGADTGWLRAHIVRNGTDNLIHFFAQSTTTVDGTGTTHVDSALPDLYFSSNLAYLRLAKTGTTYTFYASPDNVVWNQQTEFNWSGTVKRGGPILLKAATASSSTVDVDWFRTTLAVGAVTEVFPQDASGTGQAYGPDRVDTFQTGASGKALDPQIGITVSAVTAEATGDAAASPKVAVEGVAEVVGAAYNAIADRSDRADVHEGAEASVEAYDPGPSVAVNAQTA